MWQMLRRPDVRRALNVVGAVSCAGLIGFAYYLQYAQGLPPCPLCILQRIAFMLLALAFLAAGVHAPRGAGRWGYVLLLLIVGGAGGAIAGRHVYLQHLPADQVAACGPDLGYIVSSLPLLEALEVILRGSGSCAATQWTWLSLNIPEWALLWFVVLTGAGVLVNAVRPAPSPIR